MCRKSRENGSYTEAFFELCRCNDKKIKDDFCGACLHLPANNIYIGKNGKSKA